MINRITFKEFEMLCSYVIKRVTDEGRTPLSIAVTDEASNLIFMAHMDNLHSRTGYLAFKKAATSAKMGVTTEALRDRCKANGFTLADYACSDQMTLMPGGAPIFDETDEVIGGIGISGWKAEEDQQVAIQCASLIKEGRCK